MRTILAIALVAQCLLLAGPTSAEDCAHSRSGPAPDPHEWSDYGGTPDIRAPAETGLTAGEIAALFGRLGSTDQAERARAADVLRAGAPGSEGSLRKALWGRHGARNAEMREAFRTSKRRAEASEGKKSLFEALCAIDPAREDLGKGARGALRIMSLLRALDGLHTLAAYKVMIEFSPRHAGVFRREIGRMLVAHGLDALPALVYSRGSPDREIHMFAVKWIRDLGNPLLSEQVKLKNPRRLAQLLEAYASVNDLDTIDVTLALTNHDSVLVRRAARRSLETYGKNAKWPARRLYENTFLVEPSRDTSTAEVLRKLYAHFDAQRLRPMTALFERGLVAMKQRDYATMEDAFFEVLRKEPMFPRREEMAKGFLALASELLEAEKRESAEQKLLLARRLSSPDSPTARLAEARLDWITAIGLEEKGIVDQMLLERVLENEPDNAEARRALDRLVEGTPGLAQLLGRAALTALFVFAAATLVLVKLRYRNGDGKR